MALPELAFADLGEDPAPTVARLPAAAGVGQLLGPGGQSLLLAPTSNLRRWAAARLGLGGPPRPGRRPPTSLRGVASVVGWARTAAPFEQRLLYERRMAALVPPAARRDLKPPAFLHLDPAERFPRLSVRTAAAEPRDLFGPFRSRRAAETAREALHRRFPLRPCDYTFEPDPALPLGLGCLFAQVRSCAAPCLMRTSEEDYRALAARAAAYLGDPDARVQGADTIAAPVAAIDQSRALVVDPGRSEIGLYPVRAGRVLEHAAVVAPAATLAEAVARLDWPDGEGADDWAWLSAWIHGPKGRRSFLPVPDPADRADLLRRVWAALPPRLATAHER